MKNIKKITSKLCYSMMALAFSFFINASSLSAAPLLLSDAPLFSGNTEIPNVFFEIDDSGSMDWEILTQSYWHFCAYDPNAAGNSGDKDCDDGLRVDGLFRTHTGNAFRTFEYLYSEADNVYPPRCKIGGESLGSSYESCADDGDTTAIDSDWRVRSSAVNVLYYSPAEQYIPWAGLSNATFTAARSDPQPETDGYLSTRNLAGFVYEVWVDDKGYGGTRPRRGTNHNNNSNPNGEVDLWDSHYQVTAQAAAVTVKKISYAPADDGLHPSSAPITSGSAEWQSVLGNNANGSLRTIADVQQSVANWYQYSRRRSFVAKGATAAVLTANPGFRYGLSVINDDKSLFRTVPAEGVTDFTTHNSNLLEAFYRFKWPASDTPLRRGLESVGKYYAGKRSKVATPIVSQCQQNFSILVTDGYWNGPAPVSAIGDADNDGYNPTVADVAKYYYDTDLRSDLIDGVPTTSKDQNNKQHMVTFTVAFGVDGLLEDTDGDGWPNPALTESSNWGDPFGADSPEKIDDLWHAAYNSKGSYISAQTPLDVVKGLNDALGDIANRTSSASAVAANSTTLNSDTAIFQALFTGDVWSGDLRKLRVSDGTANSTACLNLQRGSICPTPAWSAKTQLELQAYNSGREILSYNPTEKAGVTFTFPSNYDAIVGGSSDADKIDKNQIIALLASAPYSATTSTASEISANQSYGNDLAAFLRGDRSNEGTGRNFRTRVAKMGDVINSAPFFVDAPRFRYPDSIESVAYSTFKTVNKNRTGMVYVGGNDGMLHGFDVANGNEKLAFLPSAIFSNLYTLSVPGYNHKYFVDGSPTVGDVFFTKDSSWRSVLVGGLNAGGKSVYALDVTNPANFSESNAKNIALWEFTDSDLGYTYGTPDVVKMNNGTWAAIFGNGFNNTGSGQSGIFIVDIETGELIKKILTGKGNLTTPNGITGVTPVDINGDFAVDYIYGGDLQGNLWKFDLRSSNVSQWDVAYKSLLGPVKLPIFTATSPTNGNPQPITTRPTVTKHPDSNRDGYIVYFGTGKYIETTDNQSMNQDTQTFYGIWDRDNTTLTAINKSTDLLKQEVSLEARISYDFDSDGNIDLNRDVRVTTANSIDWNNDSGWYIDLISTETGSTNLGERQVTNPIVRNGRVIFTTLLPAMSTCSFGGSSWLMELDAESGSRLPTAPFDLNNDGILDNNDSYVTQDDLVLPPGGLRFDGIITMPRILGGGELDFKNFGNTSSQNVSTIGEGSGDNLGRISWRQIVK